jgi:uncharacterized protein (UPF0254 family)
MARGWESKAVEQQQAEAMAPADRTAARLTPEQRVKQQQREGLRLSRERILEQLQKAKNPAHHQMLERALAELDQQLARLG